ncbi:hypothetical protein [Priestia endophytica]|uniref:hypothetical protein n=1 Tax=Priestia endophytica TaxID=135735 RepID=UPI00227DAAF2|nr:hypothetical protein [Priestia endophytica]MCY8234820.1 hypothetical protein [Priestia endophytica]
MDGSLKSFQSEEAIISIDYRGLWFYSSVDGEKAGYIRDSVVGSNSTKGVDFSSSLDYRAIGFESPTIAEHTNSWIFMDYNNRQTDIWVRFR